MWMTLNSSKVVHLFRCAVTSSFIYKYRGGNLSFQQEGLIYIFFHFLQSSFVTFNITLPQKNLTFTKSRKQQIIIKRRKMNEWWEAKYQEWMGRTLWTSLVKLFLLLCTWQFTISLPRAGESKSKPYVPQFAPNQRNIPS